MMTNCFDNLRKSAADDGASHPVVPVACRFDDDVDGLLRAWFCERSRRIETDLVLVQIRKFISRFLKSGSGSTAELKCARRLMRSIQQTIHPIEGESD